VLIAQAAESHFTLSAALLALELPPSLLFTPHRALASEKQLWTLWIVCWMALAFFSKATKRSESPVQRIEHLFPAIAGFFLIFWDRSMTGWPATPLFHPGPILLLACVISTVAGLLFSVWARLTLGSNWSGTVTIKQDHKLIRRGPYRWIRHPIYTGMLLALLGSALTQGMVSGAIGFALVLLAFYRKARREESFLSHEFGEGFIDHQRHTGMFLPRFS